MPASIPIPSLTGRDNPWCLPNQQCALRPSLGCLPYPSAARTEPDGRYTKRTSTHQLPTACPPARRCHLPASARTPGLPPAPSVRAGPSPAPGTACGAPPPRRLHIHPSDPSQNPRRTLPWLQGLIVLTSSRQPPAKPPARPFAVPAPLVRQINTGHDSIEYLHHP